MSLKQPPIGAIPAETVRVAKAAFPKGSPLTGERKFCLVLKQGINQYSV